MIFSYARSGGLLTLFRISHGSIMVSISNCMRFFRFVVMSNH